MGNAKWLLGKKGNSIVEMMVVLVIISFWVVGAYEIIDGGVKMAITTENRIQAINIAREGIEAMESVRNTNWMKFSSDYDHCFDTLNYDESCVGNASHTNKLYTATPPLLTNSWGIWYLTGAVSSWSGIVYDENGLTAQYLAKPALPNCASDLHENCISKFTRTISIANVWDAANPKMEISSKVNWTDISKNTPYTVELKHRLTNWKKNF